MQVIMSPSVEGVKLSVTTSRALSSVAIGEHTPAIAGGRATESSTGCQSLHNVQESREARRAKRDLDNTRLSESLGVELPKSVRACQASKRGYPGGWSLALKGRSGTAVAGEIKAVPFECRSWRCDCQCVRRVMTLPAEQRSKCSCCACTDGKILFARLDASFKRSPNWWTFVTLTLNQKAFRAKFAAECRRAEASLRSRMGIPFGPLTEAADRQLRKVRFSKRRCTEAAFRGLVTRFRSFSKWLRRNYGIDAYVSIVEQHAKGEPHLHIAVQSQKFYAAVPAVGDVEGQKLFWSREVKKHAVACGFGYIGDVGRAKDLQALTGYVVKVTGLQRELADGGNKSQLPVNAPARFRRVRSSKGFIVPKIKSEMYTGALVQLPQAEVAESLQKEQELRALRSAREKPFVVDSVTGEILTDLCGEVVARKPVLPPVRTDHQEIEDREIWRSRWLSKMRASILEEIGAAVPRREPDKVPVEGGVTNESLSGQAQ